MAHLRGFQTIVLSILIVLICTSEEGNGAKMKMRRKQVKNENQLINSLLEVYNSVVRPIERPSDTILVSFGLSLLKILEIDEHFGCINTVEQTMEWNDRRLRWNPGEYSNISSISIPIHRIWQPDIVLYNNKRNNNYPAFSTNAVVWSDGTIKHVAPYIMVTSCEIQPGAIEFTCSFNFGSWTHSKSELNLFMQDEDNGGDISKYIPRIDLEIIEFPGVRTEKRNAWLPQPYVDITYNLVLRNTSTEL